MSSFLYSAITVTVATYVGFALNNNVGVLGEHVAHGFVVLDAWAFVVDVFDENVVHLLGAETFVVAGFELEGVRAVVVVARIAFSIERGRLKSALEVENGNDFLHERKLDCQNCDQRRKSLAGPS